MRTRLLFFAACLVFSATLSAQAGHPAKGSWSGNMGPAEDDMSRLRLLINAWDGELSGVVNPGRRGTDMSQVILDPDTWTLTIHATLPDGELVLTGTLSNLGSWTNRKYQGTYTLNGEKGNFALTLN